MNHALEIGKSGPKMQMPLAIRQMPCAPIWPFIIDTFFADNGYVVKQTTTYRLRRRYHCYVVFHQTL